MISLAILSSGCGEDSNAEAPPEITVAGTIYHIYSSSTYGETYNDVTTTAACPDTMQAVSAGCNCRPTPIGEVMVVWSGAVAIQSQYVADNAAHCDCEYSEGVLGYDNNIRTEAAYVNCAETVYNSGSAP